MPPEFKDDLVDISSQPSPEGDKNKEEEQKQPEFKTLEEAFPDAEICKIVEEILKNHKGVDNLTEKFLNYLSKNGGIAKELVGQPEKVIKNIIVSYIDECTQSEDIPSYKNDNINTKEQALQEKIEITIINSNDNNQQKQKGIQQVV
jgi:hypothetical protein